MRRQQKILTGHGRALHCHHVLRLATPHIRVVIHVLHTEAEQHQHRRSRHPGPGTLRIRLNERRGHTVGLQVRAQLRAHGPRQAGLVLRVAQHDEAPGLTVVG